MILIFAEKEASCRFQQSREVVSLWVFAYSNSLNLRVDSFGSNNFFTRIGEDIFIYFWKFAFYASRLNFKVPF